MKIFNCSNNNLKSLRVNHLKQMNQLDCSYNKITELDLMNMGWNLNYVNCNDNLLQKLMVNNTILYFLEASNNFLEVLDVSWQKGLGYLNLKNNRLIHLNIQNSDSNLPSNGGLDLSENPNLSFICTDDFVVNAYKMYLSNANIQNVKVSEKCYFKPLITPNPVYENFQLTSMRQMKTVRIYNVNGTDVNGCVNTANVTVNVNDCVGIQQLSSAKLNVSVYPNPTTNSVNVNGLVKGDIVTVSDITGRTIQSKSFGGDNQLSFDLTNSNTGVYFINISRSGKITSTNKIVKN